MIKKNVSFWLMVLCVGAQLCAMDPAQEGRGLKRNADEEIGGVAKRAKIVTYTVQRNEEIDFSAKLPGSKGIGICDLKDSAQDSYLITAFIDEKKVGGVIFLKGEEALGKVLVSMLYVNPEYRGRQIGQGLMTNLINVVKQELPDVTKICLNAQPFSDVEDETYTDYSDGIYSDYSDDSRGEDRAYTKKLRSLVKFYKQKLGFSLAKKFSKKKIYAEGTTIDFQKIIPRA